eukprot:358247-Chlamydomonas_euryale.AAC.4
MLRCPECGFEAQQQLGKDLHILLLNDKDFSTFPGSSNPNNHTHDEVAQDMRSLISSTALMQGSHAGPHAQGCGLKDRVANVQAHDYTDRLASEKPA